MALVRVALDARSYDIAIEDGALDRAGILLAPYARQGRLVVVTDSHVAAAQLPRLETALAASGVTVEPIVLPAGEQTKSWRHLEQLLDALLALEIERGDHVVALGGGVIGDLVGFAASILKRGCHFVQVPTTLLAQVDSSVGGKTAINTRAGKNLVGSFYQPALVLIDPSTLDTLPPRETRAGYAEVVKYGLIDDPAFFAWCESDGQRLLAGDRGARVHAIEKSVRAKAAIVADDERETTGRRALLNLGHTFGHALEADTGFSDTLLHGEAVAAGMALAFRYSARLGLCPQADADRVMAHLRSVGLPYDLISARVQADGAALVAHMLHDKKMAAGTLPFLLARGIGQTFLSKDVALEDVAAFLDGERVAGGVKHVGVQKTATLGASAYVIADHAHCLYEPRANAAVRIVPPYGTKVAVIGEEGDWALVRFHGKDAWSPLANLSTDLIPARPAVDVGTVPAANNEWRSPRPGISSSDIQVEYGPRGGRYIRTPSGFKRYL